MVQTDTADFGLESMVDYLRRNPDLFTKHPELLEILSFNDDRGTSSLIERQVDKLKQRLQSYRSQQQEMIQLARENEQISDSFSDLGCLLIGFSNLSEFAFEFPKVLRDTFQIDEVAFKTGQAVIRRPAEQQSYQETLLRLHNNQAVCDNRWPSHIVDLFFSGTIESAALVPMKIEHDAEPIGVLALGSVNKLRYTNDLGTAHLNRLGLMSGICLARLQQGL